MVSRRDVVTGSVWGTLAATAMAAPAEAGQGGVDAEVLQAGLTSIQRSLADIRSVLDDGLRQPTLSFGHITRVRSAFEAFLKANGRFPEFCEIGTQVFFEVYDWHVKHSQQIQIIRMSDTRMAIQFMFTQLVLRWENDPTYVGTPFDRA